MRFTAAGGHVRALPYVGDIVCVRHIAQIARPHAHRAVRVGEQGVMGDTCQRLRTTAPHARPTNAPGARRIASHR